MKGNALKHAMEDVVVGCASAAIVGRAVGAVVSGLNAGSDYANGKIKQEEAVKQMKAGTAAGAIAGSATKFVDTGCQAAAKTLAAEGSLAGAACSRNAVMELVVAACTPLYVAVVLPGILDAVVATSMAVPMLLLGPLGWFLSFANMASGLVIVPLLHCAVRLAQYMLGELDDRNKYRNYIKEVEAAVSWAEKNRELLGSDGRLVLCGYSSGGHVASLYGLEQCAVPTGKRRFEAVVLVSGIYDLRTNWKGFKGVLSPVLNLLYGDRSSGGGSGGGFQYGLNYQATMSFHQFPIAGGSPAQTTGWSSVSSGAVLQAVLESKQQKDLDPDCTWWVLNAKKDGGSDGQLESLRGRCDQEMMEMVGMPLTDQSEPLFNADSLR
eukprot:Skav235120  [mRNA]  locus=scaffold3581:228285:236713:- [translate_table: standard]